MKYGFMDDRTQLKRWFCFATGSKVRNVVLDKKMLAKTALQIQSVVVFLAPIILSYRAEAEDTQPKAPNFNGYVNVTTMTCADLGC